MNTGDVAKVWEQSRELLLLREEMRSPLASVYLDYLVPISLGEKQITLAVWLLQAKQWIEERYLTYIQESVMTIMDGPCDVVLVLDETVGRTSSHAGATPKQLSAQESPSGPPAGQQISLVGQPAVDQHVAHGVVADTSREESHIAASLASQQSVADPPLFQQQDFSQPFNPRTEAHTADVSTVPLPGQSTSVNSGVSLNSGLSAVFAPDTHQQATPSVDPGSRFVFSNYVMGNSNEFAYKASTRVAEAPGLYFNPLFIYGRSGLGKTHLLLAIRNYINTYLPDKRVVYAPTTEFVNDFTNAMAGDRDLTSFKLKYHTCDVLLIDDVQNLEGKEGTTDALFEIFNMFVESKKQIVLSADRSPVEINLDERFTSRFAQGITADIQPPNFEMKTAILKNYKRYYCAFLNIPEVSFSDDSIQKIVELSGSNIRELEGAVSNLIVSVSCRPGSQKLAPVTIDDVERVLGNSFFHTNTQRVDIDMILQAVETYFNVSRSELKSEKRSKNISHPRQVAMYLIRLHTDMSYPEIGDSFNKDHTTVMYADRNIQAKMIEEAGIKTEVERITEMLTL